MFPAHRWPSGTVCPFDIALPNGYSYPVSGQIARLIRSTNELPPAAGWPPLFGFVWWPPDRAVRPDSGISRGRAECSSAPPPEIRPGPD